MLLSKREFDITYFGNILVFSLFIFFLIKKRTKKIKTDYKILRKYYGTTRHG